MTLGNELEHSHLVRSDNDMQLKGRTRVNKISSSRKKINKYMSIVVDDCNACVFVTIEPLMFQ